MIWWIFQPLQTSCLRSGLRDRLHRDDAAHQVPTQPQAVFPLSLQSLCQSLRTTWDLWELVTGARRLWGHWEETHGKHESAQPMEHGSSNQDFHILHALLWNHTCITSWQILPNSILVIPAMAKEERTTHSLVAKKWEDIPELRRKAQRLELATCQHWPSNQPPWL